MSQTGVGHVKLSSKVCTACLSCMEEETGPNMIMSLQGGNNFNRPILQPFSRLACGIQQVTVSYQTNASEGRQCIACLGRNITFAL